MAVYVWLACIQKMQIFESMQEYHESHAYDAIVHGNMGYHYLMVDRNTPLWKGF